MYRFIQNHGKKLMAVFTAVLMITMALPSATNFAGGNSDVIGKLDNEKLHQPEFLRAYNAWELLIRTPFTTREQPQRADISLVQALLPPQAIAQIREHPILFLLLQKEAQRMGIGVSPDMLNGWIANVPSLKTGDPDRDDDLRAALMQLILVQQAYNRAAGAVKVSEPLIDLHLAGARQSITLTATEFTTAQYTGKVPPISAEQLKAQFEQYAKVIRGNVDASNPFGFGYKYPDRVKLQYIGLSRTAVRKFVQENSAPGKPKDPYEWEVEAQKYYRQHQTQYLTTRPAPTTASTRPEPSVPTTKPFADVRQQIIDQLINEETDKKMAQIQERITGTLAGDWVAYQSATATTMPSTLPATTFGVPYNSVEYLQKVATFIQSTYGVLPAVQSIADHWLTIEDLARLPGISKATRSHPVQPMPMPIYLVSMSAAFVSEANRNHPDVIETFEPTRPMTDGDTVYIARISATDPSHMPASMAEVETQVRQDAITKAAYDLARADAAKLLEHAKQSDLKSAAAGRSLVTIGPLSREPGPSVPGLAISGPSVNDFLQKAFKLLTTPTSRPAGKPIDLVELQRDNRVLVAELTSVQALWNEQTREMEEAQVAEQLQREFQQRFSQEWFNYNAVASRLKFVPEGGTAPQMPTAPPEPVAPVF
jgi:hypothetical protein